MKIKGKVGRTIFMLRDGPRGQLSVPYCPFGPKGPITYFWVLSGDRAGGITVII